MKLFIVSTALNEGHSYGRLKTILTEAGHEVLEPPDSTNTWGYIAANYTLWDPLEYRTNLYSDDVQQHFQEVKSVMRQAEGCILMLPASPASHMVAGWFVGRDKPLFIIFLQPEDPNVMHLLADKITVGSTELGEALNEVAVEEVEKNRFFNYMLHAGSDVVGPVELTAGGAWIHIRSYLSDEDLARLTEKLNAVEP